MKTARTRAARADQQRLSRAASEVGIATCLVLSLLAGHAFAAEPHTANTFRLQPDEARPTATLEDARWLVGSYAGTAFGGQFEQHWSAPSAGTMVGTFKLMEDGQVVFYELLLLSVEDGTLSLKVKHFNPDFSAWEEKADFIDFRLVKLNEDELHFGGLSFYRQGDNAIDAYIVMRSGETVREEKLEYRRLH